MSTWQVGWEWRGLAVWSPSGCRLVCSLRQTAQDAVSTPRVPLSVHSPLIPSGPGSMPLPLESGISAMTWSAAGYSLLLTETASSGQMLELALARSLDAAHRVVQGSRPGSAPAANGFFSGRPAKQARHWDLSDIAVQNTNAGRSASLAIHSKRPAPDSRFDLVVCHCHFALWMQSLHWSQQKPLHVQEIHALLGSDRLLLIHELPEEGRSSSQFREADGAGPGSDLTVHHLRPPDQCAFWEHRLGHDLQAVEGCA